MTWPALDAKLLADSAATFNFRLGTPTPLAITRDGAVLFRRTPPRAFEADLFELDPATGAVRTVVTAAELLGARDEQLSNAEKARRERTRTATRGVVDIGVSVDGTIVMIPLGGKLHRIVRRTGERIAIDPGGAAYDPQLSPDGARIAFVRDGDVWLADGTGKPRQLTHHPEGFEYGVAEFAAQEELARRRGLWWSPDGKQLLFQRTDARAVDTIYVADPRNPEKPPVPFKYPRAGRPNAIVDLGVVSADGGEPRWLTWDVAKYPYLARVAWHAHEPLTLVVLSRDQTELAALAIDDAMTGKPRVVLTEHDAAWVNVPDPKSLGYAGGTPLWLPNAAGFLWTTERDGAWTLELHPVHGVAQRLTAPELGLRALVGFDAEAGDALVEASALPTRSDLWRISISASHPPVRITDGDGVTGGSFDHGVLIATTARHDGGVRTVVIAGGRASELPSVAERPALVPTTEIEAIELGGRTHYAAITRPRRFEPGRRYPVLVDVYAGPHRQHVVDARDAYVMDQFYADAGFIVIRSDGRGTPNRGRAWERAIAEDLITVPLDDQVGALQALGARHPELDLARVGVFGWSFGGYFATMAVLLRPDVFACAIAGAPVTDWSLYDTAYTERYMRTPERNPDGYKRTSALEHAAKLSRPLLVIHGITDDNVHFANTLALIEALYVAGKRAEVITLSATHMVPDPKLNLAREQVQIDFFRDHLGRSPP